MTYFSFWLERTDSFAVPEDVKQRSSADSHPGSAEAGGLHACGKSGLDRAERGRAHRHLPLRHRIAA